MWTSLTTFPVTAMVSESATVLIISMYKQSFTGKQFFQVFIVSPEQQFFSLRYTLRNDFLFRNSEMIVFLIFLSPGVT